MKMSCSTLGQGSEKKDGRDGITSLIKMGMNTEESAVKLKKYKIKQLEVILQHILNLLKILDEDNENFIQLFQQFNTVRENCIILMRKNADELDELHSECNETKVFGAKVSLIAGAVGTVVTVASGGTATPLVAIAGYTISVLGGINILRTSVSEKFSEKKKLTVIQKELKKDDQISKKLLQKIQTRNEVREAIEELMNYSIFEEILKRFGDQFFTNYKIELERKCLPPVVINYIGELPLSTSQKENLINLLSDIFLHESCRMLYATIAALYQTCFPILSILFTSGIFLKTANMYDDFVNAGKTALAAATVGKLSTVLKGVKLLSAVCIAIDLYTWLEASSDMKNGSKSQLADKIRTCANKMDEELKIMSFVYVEIYQSISSGKTNAGGTSDSGSGRIDK